jgi:hypothetical protein
MSDKVFIIYKDLVRNISPQEEFNLKDKMKIIKTIGIGIGVLACGIIAMIYAMSGAGSENISQGRTPEENYYNLSAHYIAGIPIESNDAIKKLTASREYHSFRKSAGSMWSGYQKRNLSKIHEFQEQYLSRIQGDVVFYPFSGPDILNALAFFPRAGTFIMVGMEPPGGFVDVVKLGAGNSVQGLIGLRESVRQILGHNFFHTKIMKRNVGTTALTSVASIMQFFIVRSGFHVASVRNITFSPEGDIIADTARKSTSGAESKGAVTVYPKAVEIVFHKPGSAEMKKVIYVKADMADSSFYRYRGFIKYLLAKSDYITILKAASYLMFRRQFDDVRNIILNNSQIVVQDSSGIPYHFFKDGRWDITFFGRYVQPIPLFAVRHQSNLADDMSKGRNRQRLPFYYGYTSTRSTGAHLIIARKKSNAVNTAVVLDKNSYRGIETICQSGRTVIREYR